MNERDKIIKDLDDLENIMITRQEICPKEELQYWIELQESLSDALALLKEQDEAVVPVKHIDNDKKHGRVIVWWGCPVCNFLLNGKETRFCGGCGRSVKWE